MLARDLGGYELGQDENAIMDVPADVCDPTQHERSNWSFGRQDLQRINNQTLIIFMPFWIAYIWKLMGITVDAHLKDRLDFIGIDDDARRALAEAAPIISEAVAAALDAFYVKATRHPVTSALFSDPAHVTHAKSRQQAHWETIASGQYSSDYVEAVSAVGRTHARLGLEPRWYIGGYALILDGIVRSLIAEALQGVMHRQVPWRAA